MTLLPGMLPADQSLSSVFACWTPQLLGQLSQHPRSLEKAHGALCVHNDLQDKLDLEAQRRVAMAPGPTQARRGSSRSSRASWRSARSLPGQGGARCRGRAQLLPGCQRPPGCTPTTAPSTSRCRQPQHLLTLFKKLQEFGDPAKLWLLWDSSSLIKSTQPLSVGNSWRTV